MPRDVVGHISPVLTVPPHSKEPIIENTLVAFPKLKSMKKGYTRERTNNNNNPQNHPNNHPQSLQNQSPLYLMMLLIPKPIQSPKEGLKR